MSATRTQVYLTDEQRRRIDALVQSEGVTMAEVVRRALDAYLEAESPDSASVLEATFGVDPAMKTPDRDEWQRG